MTLDYPLPVTPEPDDGGISKERALRRSQESIRLAQEIRDVVQSIREAEGSEPADGAQLEQQTSFGSLLDSIVTYVKRYVLLTSPEQYWAIALWVAFTWVFDQVSICPYLAILSPEKRSGKTRLLEALEQLVSRPWRAVDVSEAVLFRKIERDRPTLLLDEVDTVFNSKNGGRYEALRSLLNAGFSRGAVVSRCEGKDAIALKDFSPFCPKALAGIGKCLPDTIVDRSIIMPMVRRSGQEKVERFRARSATQAAEPIRQSLDSWAAEADIRDREIQLPDVLDDRAQDCWEPLFLIAELAGLEWLERARSASHSLAAGRTAEDSSMGVRILASCLEVFESQQMDRLPTVQLLRGLADTESYPFQNHPNETLTATRLANLLKPYGIYPRQHRFGDKTLKGYLESDFHDSWKRYLGWNPDPDAGQGETSETHLQNAQKWGETE